MDLLARDAYDDRLCDRDQKKKCVPTSNPTVFGARYAVSSTVSWVVRKSMKTNNIKPDALGQACRFALVAQLIMFLFLSLILDGGLLAGSMLICMLGHWCTVGFILIRRHKNATRADLIMARSGFLIYWLLLIGVVMINGLLRR